jgi:hypothetical protein
MEPITFDLACDCGTVTPLAIKFSGGLADMSPEALAEHIRTFLDASVRDTRARDTLVRIVKAEVTAAHAEKAKAAARLRDAEAALAVAKAIR